MFVPKVPRISPVRFLSENLLSLLRPGKTFSAKVETLEGRLLTISVGNERLEALLDESIPQGSIRPGQELRLKVVSTGEPIVLSLETVGPSSKPRTDNLSNFVRSLVLISTSDTGSSPFHPAPRENPLPEKLLLNFLKALQEEGKQKNESAPFKENLPPEGEHKSLSRSSWPSEEALKDQIQGRTPREDRKTLPESRLDLYTSKDLRGLDHTRSSPEAKTEGPLAKAEHLPQEVREGLLKLWQEGVFVLPFIFGDRISWECLYEREPLEQKRGGERLFVLQLFLSRLGFVESHFMLWGGQLLLKIYFAREEALEEARKQLANLLERLSSSGVRAKVSLSPLSSLPGTLLDLKETLPG